MSEHHTEELIRDNCPYCGEPIDLLVDCSVANQHYIEDCQVCCRPIEIHQAVASDGAPILTLLSENE